MNGKEILAPSEPASPSEWLAEILRCEPERGLFRAFRPGDAGARTVPRDAALRHRLSRPASASSTSRYFWASSAIRWCWGSPTPAPSSACILTGWAGCRQPRPSANTTQSPSTRGILPLIVRISTGNRVVDGYGGPHRHPAKSHTTERFCHFSSVRFELLAEQLNYLNTGWSSLSTSSAVKMLLSGIGTLWTVFESVMGLRKKFPCSIASLKVVVLLQSPHSIPDCLCKLA
jgi:hypothetical protein